MTPAVASPAPAAASSSSSLAPNGRHPSPPASPSKQQQQHQQQHQRSSLTPAPASPRKPSPARQPSTPGNAAPASHSVPDDAAAEPVASAAATPSANAQGTDSPMHGEEQPTAMDVDVDIVADEEDDHDSEEEEDDDDDDDDSEDDDDSDDDDIAIIGPDGQPEPVDVEMPSATVKVEAGDSADAAEGTAAPAADADEPPVNVLQPKKKRARRSPSSDEDLPPPPPPMPTIRLEVDLPVGSEEPLDWNFIDQAALAGHPVLNAWGEAPGLGDPFGDPAELRAGAGGVGGEDTPMTEATGDVPPLSGPPPAGMSEAEVREMEAIAARLEAKYEDKGKKKVSKKRRVIDYDLNDPFIDDSDLGIDAPTHVARPKKEGFFVNQGPLELMEESPVERAKRSKPSRAKNTGREPRQSLSAAVRAFIAAHGTPGEPIALGRDGDETTLTYTPRSPSPPGDQDYNVNRSLFKNASREDKYLPPFSEFPDEVAHGLRSLRRQSLDQRWDPSNKGRFPEHLKPPLRKAGEAAFHHDLLCVVDKEPTDGSYERYQEKAFVTALTSCLPYNRLTLGKLVLKLCYEEYYAWLLACEHEGLRQWNELLVPEFDNMLQEWAKAKEEHEAKQEEPEIVDSEDKETKTKSDGPKRNPVFTPDMRDIFRQLVENTQEMVDVNKKLEEWGQPIKGQSSELNMRKFLYNRIIAIYPPEFMTTLTLSRAYTNYKRSGHGSKQHHDKQDKE